MSTLASWIAETRDHLDGDRSFEANQLASSYTAGAGTLAFSNALGNIGPGARLSVGTNVFLVLTVDAAAKTATVLGGQAGSTDANAASGALVRVNPRFTDYQIAREINRHLSSLSSPSNGLYRVGTVQVAYDDDIQGYNLTGITGLIRVLEVRRQVSGVSKAWPRVRTADWDLLRSAPTSDFAAGISLRLIRREESGHQVQVVYAYGFTDIDTTNLAAAISTTGVPSEAQDIPPLGAAIRLMSGREIPRNHTGSQGDTRRANEVPPGAVGASYRGLLGQWQQRVREESARLRAQFPVGK